MSSRLGRLRIDFAGSHPVRHLVEDEMNMAGAGGAPIGLTIEIESDPPVMDGVRLAGSRLQLRHAVTASDDRLRAYIGLKHGGMLYTVDVDSSLMQGVDARAAVYLRRDLSLLSRLTGPASRVLSRDASSLLEVAAKNVIYEIVDAVAEYRLLTIGSSLLHASAVGRGGSALVITGTGGVGKSTSLLAAMSEFDDLSYLGDDMVVVDADGTVHRHPKRIQIYEYNLLGSPLLRQRLLADMAFGRRLLWRTRARLLGAKQARIRLSAEQLFGADRVDDVGALSTVVWVRPTAEPDIRLAEIDCTTLARRSAVAILDELWDFNRLMSLGSLVSSVGVNSADLQSRAEEVYAAAFSEASCFEMGVPYMTNPRRLAETVVAAAGW